MEIRNKALLKLAGVAAMTFGLLDWSGCDAAGSGGPKNELTRMETATVTARNAAGQSHSFTVWLARDYQEQQLGLMNVTEQELGRDQGMLFIFDRDAPRGFWMRNTIIPLDIAYVRSDGTIVRTLTMQALDESIYPSIEPARFALEVRAGELAARGLQAGDHLEIDPSLLNERSGPTDE